MHIEFCITRFYQLSNNSIIQARLLKSHHIIIKGENTEIIMNRVWRLCNNPWTAGFFLWSMCESAFIHFIHFFYTALHYVWFCLKLFKLAFEENSNIGTFYIFSVFKHFFCVILCGSKYNVRIQEIFKNFITLQAILLQVIQQYCTVCYVEYYSSVCGI